MTKKLKKKKAKKKLKKEEEPNSLTEENLEAQGIPSSAVMDMEDLEEEEN